LLVRSLTREVQIPPPPPIDAGLLPAAARIADDVAMREKDRADRGE
jgi:hypothetical protein